MTAPLPLGLTYGTVRWQVVGIAEDSLDAGSNPDTELINGKVTFRPMVDNGIKYVGTVTDPQPKTVLPRRYDYLVVNGILQDKSGNPDIRLVANDAEGTSPQGWQYLVEYELAGGYSFGSFRFTLETEEIVDLTREIPQADVDGVLYVTGPAGPPGPGLPVGGTTGQVLAKLSNANSDTGWTTVVGGGGATDHGALTGLADDDHPQYLNNARGDARYVGTADARLSDARTPLAHDHDARYYTETEADTQITAAKARANHTGTQSLDTTTDSATRLALTAAERTKLAGIATGATVNATDAALRDRTTHTGTQSLDTTTDSATRLALTAAERTKLAGIATGATVNSTDATLLARVNHTGTQSADTLTDGVTNKAFLATERTKLTGVATGATANATDAQLRDRSTHTGTQLSGTLSDLTEAVQDIVGAFIAAGTGLTKTYDDALNTFTLTATGGGGTTDPEIVRDTIGSALVQGAGINIVVNDVGDTLTISSTAVLPTRQVISGTGLAGGGDLSADRTLTVTYGTTAGTAAQGNDSRLSDARTPTAHAASHATGAGDPITPAAIGAAASSHTHTASQVSDSTATGRAVLTAIDAAAARLAIGAGTSSLAIGTTGTTAKAGDYAPPADAAAGTASMRTLGTGATQAAAGNDSRLSDARVPTAHDHDTRYYTEGETDLKLAERAPLAHTHTAANISDSTATGRSVLQAADAAAARTAIGAGTSNLAIGTTSTTAKAGDATTSAGARSVLEFFRIQLPTGVTGTVNEVNPAALMAGYQDANFMETADGRGFYFYVPVNGVTTSGTTFARAEMRELNADGSLAGYTPSATETRVWEATVRILHLPVGDRETTFFQIHNGTTEVTALRTTETAGGIRVAARKNGSSITPYFETNYQYGTDMKVRVELNTRVKIYYNGALIHDYPVSDLTVGTGFYMKWGNYLQADTTTASPTEYGELEMRDIFFVRNGKSFRSGILPHTHTGVVASTSIVELWKGTQAQYDALGTKSSTVMYAIQG